MYTIENLKRKFTAEINGKDMDLPDIGEDKSPEEVIKFYANIYPELLNTNIDGPNIGKDNVAVYSTKAKMGGKG